MAHELENATDMTYFGETPWHRLGVKVDRLLTPMEAAQTPGLNWAVGERPMFLANGQKIATHKAIVREDNGNLLGVVGSGFAHIQNTDVAATMQRALGDIEMVETCGSLFGGKKVWLLANLGNFTVGDGDAHKSYLLATTAHDGSAKFSMFPTAVRVVCNNTLRAAHSTDEGKGFSVKHTKNVATYIDRGVDHIARAHGWVKQYQSDCDRLLHKRMTTDESRDFVATLLNSGTARGANALESILSLSVNGAGNRPYWDTAYGLLQGITDYVDHERGTRVTDGVSRDDARFNAALLGSGNDMKLAAFQGLLKLAA